MTGSVSAPEPAGSRIALLGIGRMGHAMGLRLLDRGVSLTVWNRSPDRTAPLVEAGATAAPDVAAAATGADVVLLALADGPAVDDVLFDRGLAEALPAGGLVADLSSIAPDAARRHAKALAGAGIDHLDAPVSGGVRGARGGTLTILAGGEQEAFRRASPALGLLGQPHHLGPSGSGQLAKCVNQIIVGVTIAAVAEGMLLAAGGGADAAAVREALIGGFADSRVLREHGRRMLERDFVAGGMVATQLKDLETALDVARQERLTLPLTERTTALYRDVAAQLSPELDHSAVLLHLERAHAARPR